MKFLIICVAALLIEVYGQTQVNPGVGGVQLINQNQWRQCAQESRIEQDDLQRFKNRDLSNGRDTVQCFTNCLFERMGIIQNGDILDQKVVQILGQTIPSDQLNTKVSSCHAQARGQNKCENAYKFYVCLLNSTGNNDIFRFGEMV